MIKAIHMELLNIVKLQCRKCVIAEDDITTVVGFVCEFPNKNLHRQDGKNVLLLAGINITTPEMQIENLRVVKGWPIT